LNEEVIVNAQLKETNTKKFFVDDTAEWEGLELLNKLAGVSKKVELYAPLSLPVSCNECTLEEVNTYLYREPDFSGIIDYWRTI
jgi:hypothetical protein